MVFTDYITAFNTIIRNKLISKLLDLRFWVSIYNHLLVFLTSRPHLVKTGHNIASTLMERDASGWRETEMAGWGDRKMSVDGERDNWMGGGMPLDGTTGWRKCHWMVREGTGLGDDWIGRDPLRWITM